MSDQLSLITEYGIDPQEAPPGFSPVLKSERRHDQGNLCRQCDWRPECDGPVCGCMSYNRHDGMSVVFKRTAEAGMGEAP